MRLLLAIISVLQGTAVVCCADEIARSPVHNSIGISFTRIPPGKGVIGSPPDEPGRGRGEQRREVEFRDSYYLAVHEVTQQQYQTVMSANPSAYSPRGALHRRVSEFDTSKFPVDSVSWHEAVEFCRRLNALPAEQTAGRSYRLPTEVEWEYAARAGSETIWHFNNDPAALPKHAWFGRKQSGNRPHQVGTALPNPWGLHDMYGNLWEWCSDRGEGEDGLDQPRVIRGGSWFSTIANCRSASRAMDPASVRERDTGFRIVMQWAKETP